MRGFNGHLKHSVVKEWVRRNNMEFGCILETRVKEGKAGRILNTGHNGVVGGYLSSSELCSVQK